MAGPVALVFRTQRIHLPVGRHEIGRHEACTIVLDDPHVSRRHAALEVREDAVIVTDLGSRAGTKVNGVALDGPHAAKPGEVLSIGSQNFLFVDVRDAFRPTRSATSLPGFVCCGNCGYLVMRTVNVCPVCHVSLHLDFDVTTDVRAPPRATLSHLPVPRAAIFVSGRDQILRGLKEWSYATGDKTVLVFPTIADARQAIDLGHCTVIVDVEIIEADQGAGMRKLVSECDPMETRFVVMGPSTVNWPERSPVLGLRGVRNYLPRANSPIDLLANTHRLRLDD
jgi:hypothetical protein